MFGIFTPIPGEMIQFDEHIFQLGWFNHQLVIHCPNGSFLEARNIIPGEKKHKNHSDEWSGSGSQMIDPTRLQHCMTQSNC